MQALAEQRASDLHADAAAARRARQARRGQVAQQHDQFSATSTVRASRQRRLSAPGFVRPSL
jgi:hypothetical protein